ncbi:MAG: nucleotidyltransferase domain-containing protein [Methanophagales archaeon ANME-1-THS]|nr:MAG: nucleotidyltransferase domain-containing protein [Methanophagales archaeon ANME-1-THS]
MQSFVVEESLNSVKVFWLEQDKLIEEIYRTAQRIGKEDENIVKIILFGSLAEKRGIPGSDADILILLKKDDNPFMQRIAEWSKKFTLNFPLEIFPYTEKELTNPIIREALKKGITLFER